MARQVVLMGEARQGSWIPEPIAYLLRLLGSAPWYHIKSLCDLGKFAYPRQVSLLSWKMRIMVSSRACPMAAWTAFQGQSHPLKRD